MREFRTRLAGLAPAAPPAAPADERALLAAAVERDLVELEVLRPFQRDPGAYLTLLATSVETALLRSSGSPCARLQRAARRLAAAPEVLRAARLNLKDPPRILVELAIERGAGVLRFLREAVPRTTAGCRSTRLQADLAQADTTAVRAIEGFLDYLEQDLLPVSRGEPAIGPDACRRLLRAELAADVPPIETLLEDATRLVARRRAALDSLATLVASGGARDTSASGRAEEVGRVALIADGVERIERFLIAREVVTLRTPRAVLKVREAPPFARSSEVSLWDAGGPRGPRAPAAWLEVGAFDPTRRTGPDRRDADLAVAHMGLPGRHLRALALRDQPSRLRRALLETWPGADWGRYCEQMVLDEGLGGDDPRYRAAGNARALRDAGRALAALALHAGAMSPAEARRMLEERCLFDPAEAEREARWAAADPALMSYTLGAQRLRELQDEARRRLGPRYRTRAFHDAVLRCGASPHGAVRDRLWSELAEATGAPAVGVEP